MTWAKGDTEKKPRPKKPIGNPFTQLSKTSRGISAVIHGQEKVGKTHFALTFPGPIYVIGTEGGIDDLLAQFPDKEIYVTEIARFGDKFEIDPVESINAFDEALEWILKNVIAKIPEGESDPRKLPTIVIDSITDLWQFIQGWLRSEVLRVSKTANVQPSDYQHANAKYASVVLRLKMLPCNLVLTARDTKDWVSAGKEGTTYSPNWNKSTPFWMDVIVGIKKLRTKTKTEYRSTISSRYGREMDGLTIVDVDFDKVFDAFKEKMFLKED